MDQGDRSAIPSILPVLRSKRDARRSYDRMSRMYDYLAGAFERGHARKALECVNIEEGSIVLEVGFGTGHCLERIAESLGDPGMACGIDISSGMAQVAGRRLERSGPGRRVELQLGDAASLPYADSSFDAVFTSFTLELFDTPEIPAVLKEIGRVLRRGGRLGAISLSREYGRPVLLRLYEWAHGKWPRYLDCRPIYLERCVRDAGYEVREKRRVSLLGLPCEIVVAVKED